MHTCRLILAAASIAITAAPLSRAGDLFATKAQKAAFLRALERQDRRYDPNEHMIRRPFSSPGYHTTLKGGYVHPTRDSLKYAVALLDAGTQERLSRAEAVLRKVISLQDQDPDSRTYGIWSWFYEEPLEKMSPPDWNWADFCGTQLLQVARDHMHRLPAELQRSVRESIIHAARSIKRRNVGPGYTNIALMGTCVTLSAGELFDQAELLEYGRSRLRRFWEYTRQKGSFSEYNSPTYTVVAIEEITRMHQHITDPPSRPLLEKINRFAWFHLARHFHPPTGQWAGPHSRCYSTMLRSSTRAFIQRATAGRVEFMPEEDAWQSLEAHRVRPACPEDYFHYFTKLPEPRLEIETFKKGGAGRHDTVGTTYLHPAFTLGSANVSDLWNQRRPVLAYWNADNDDVVAARIRCLHDDYDYSSASIFTVQDKNDLLGAVVFATDRGDTHISLDRIDGTIKAKDLRLRLEFEGAVKNLTIAPARASVRNLAAKEGSGAGLHSAADSNGDAQTAQAAWCITSGAVRCGFDVPYAVFDDNRIRFETGRNDHKAWIDIILYSGREKEIDFRTIQKAAVVFTLAMNIDPSNSDSRLITIQDSAGMVRSSLETTGRDSARIAVSLKPMRTSSQRDRFSATLSKNKKN